MSSEIILLIDDNPPAKGDSLEVTEATIVPVQGCGRVELQLQQVGGIKTVTLNNVAYVSPLRHSFLFMER